MLPIAAPTASALAASAARFGISGGNAPFFATFSEAWQRQLPFLPCPLRFEDGRLFCRVTVGDDERWEEKTDIQPQARWRFVKAEELGRELDQCRFEDMPSVRAVRFLGLRNGKYSCVWL